MTNTAGLNLLQSSLHSPMALWYCLEELARLVCGIPVPLQRLKPGAYDAL